MERVNTLCKELDSLYKQLTDTHFDYTLQMAVGNLGMVTYYKMQLDTIQLHIEYIQKELRKAFDEVEK